MAKRRKNSLRKKKVNPICVKCGARKNLVFGPNPYDNEVKGNEESVWLCRRCRDELEQKI
jgi:hypothetical protein